MNFENPIVEKPTEEAEQAHTEYHYAAARDRIEYGEEPSGASFREAAAFLSELRQLDTDWEKIDFTKIDIDHLNSLQRDDERISYAVNQLVDTAAPAIERQGTIDRLTKLLGKYEKSVTSISVLLFCITSLYVAVKEERQETHDEHLTVDMALHTGSITTGPNITLSMLDERWLSPWLANPNHSTAHIAIENDAALPKTESGYNKISVTENGKTYVAEIGNSYPARIKDALDRADKYFEENQHNQ